VVFRLAPQTLEAVVEIITGGPGNSFAPPVGIYRTAYEIERFIRGCNVNFSIVGSRMPAVADKLIELNNRGDEEALTRIIEASADPRDFINEPEKHKAVLDYLNAFLVLDGFELQSYGGKVRLVARSLHAPVLDRLSTTSLGIDFDTVTLDLSRAIQSISQDPEDAVTAACSVVESVCRSILIELGLSLPEKKDIKSLYAALRKPLGLSPDRPDIDPTIADDVRKVLGGLSTAVEGIGALRTHGGDAHGRERGFRRIDKRIATLAVHCSSTIALFLIETWQLKYPGRILHLHSEEKVTN
jgi:hypothetical protein